MSAYIKQLQAGAAVEAATLQARREQEERAAEEAAREKLVPLETHLTRLLATIPPAVQAQGLSLMTLQVQLRARGRGHSRCHVGELGEALRKLGFERRRDWSGESGFSARWYPEETINRVSSKKPRSKP